MLCGSGGSQRQGQWQSDPRSLKLAIRTWNITSMMEKEPELVREVERYWLDIVGLTSTYSSGLGTGSLERSWSLFYAKFSQVEGREQVWAY